MFEKHCFIFPVVYKERAQVEAVFPVYRAASISQTCILATQERWQKSWEKEINVSLGWKIMFWFEKSEWKEKKMSRLCSSLRWNRSLLNKFKGKQASRRASHEHTFLRCRRFQVYVPILSYQQQTLENHIPVGCPVVSGLPLVNTSLSLWILNKSLERRMEISLKLMCFYFH